MLHRMTNDRTASKRNQSFRQSIRKYLQRSLFSNRSGLRKRWVTVGVSMFMAWSVPNAIAQQKNCDACQGRTSTHVPGATHCNHCDGSGVSVPSLQTLIIDKLSAAGDRFERNHAAKRSHAAKSQVLKSQTHWHTEPKFAADPSCAAKPTCATKPSIPSSLRFTKAKDPSCGVEDLGVFPKQDACDAKAFWGRTGVGSTGSLSDQQSRAIQEPSIAGSEKSSKLDSAKPIASQQPSDGRPTVPPDIAAALEHDSEPSAATNGSVTPKLIPPPANKSEASVPAPTDTTESNAADAPPIPPDVPQTLEAISKSLDESKGIESSSSPLIKGGYLPPAPIEPPKVLEKSPPSLDSVPPAPMPKPKSELEPLPDILVDPFIDDARSSKPKSPGGVELSSGKDQRKPLYLGSPSQNPINKLRLSEGTVHASLRSSEIVDEGSSAGTAPKRLSQSQKESSTRRTVAEGAASEPTPRIVIPVNGLRSN